jgi:hypothetical protein
MQLQASLIFQSMFSVMLWWIAAIAGATITGYPGAVLMTPLAWFALPLFFGVSYYHRAIIQNIPAKNAWVACGGLVMGLILGIIFAIVAQRMMPTEVNRPDELEKMANVYKFMFGGGLLVCPLVSMLGYNMARAKSKRSK